ncbi:MULTISPECIES: ATP-binding protein [Rhodococcus]|uniref:ATP-binding protein n=1 Tax=Rhodococcus indonesiensis TaxID=3055869 RepID=A0ABT7RPC9_9NOCA|nr:ATP-binding protein [Rhodococcus indonesiensis]MDM7489497.1 ATP-binding protein [Rhodococcus indonesiensis]
MATDAGARTWTLTTVTGADTLTDVHALIEEMMSAGRVEDADRFPFEIAVAEIAANIIEHAALGQPVPMSLRLRALPERLEAEFTDEGRPARVDLGTVELPDALAERGRGLAIAMAALDELSYRRQGGINRWILARERVEPT